ncbi:SRPBCC family protein [Streptomyces albidus (ex Kaewkla and Franco 2022)]|uniref:SRPBCC family protein n=1 Tax=Streptomyces albidus (ex Kaewkla and Franco 2022) TaxID=722709 RepID=UPI0015EF0481|nr:SRPBCC family protein [Streptomyces albidus (ex Kaewkla and Franco 2022)]
MQLSNAVAVRATPDEVFALVNDVERVASCMPGATLEGSDGDAWSGRVKVKVGPITAAYAGTVRFLEVDAEKRRLRVQARGADTHGSGDAEAEVSLEVAEAPEGAELRLVTDLVIRGKIAQFGKGAVGAVSDRILQQFARNLGSLLDQDRRGTDAAGPAPGSASASQLPAAAAQSGFKAPSEGAASELNGLSVLVPPAVAKYGPVVGAFAFGLFEGWLLGRVLTREKHHCCGARSTR